MAYDTGVPATGQSPALFPAQGAENFSRLKTIMAAGHKFNDSAATDDGYHQLVKWLPTSTPSNDATVGQAYVSDQISEKQLFWKDSLNRTWQVTPCMPLRASVTFNAAGTIRSTFNVGSVTRNPGGAGNGTYRIAFAIALPSNNYYYTITGFNDSSRFVLGQPRNGVAYTTYITTTTFDVVFYNSSDSQVTDLIGCSVIFYGG